MIAPGAPHTCALTAQPVQLLTWRLPWLEGQPMQPFKVRQCNPACAILPVQPCALESGAAHLLTPVDAQPKPACNLADCSHRCERHPTSRPTCQRVTRSWGLQLCQPRRVLQHHEVRICWWASAARHLASRTCGISVRCTAGGSSAVLHYFVLYSARSAASHSLQGMLGSGSWRAAHILRCGAPPACPA